MIDGIADMAGTESVLLYLLFIYMQVYHIHVHAGISMYMQVYPYTCTCKYIYIHVHAGCSFLNCRIYYAARSWFDLFSPSLPW